MGLLVAPWEENLRYEPTGSRNANSDTGKLITEGDQGISWLAVTLSNLGHRLRGSEGDQGISWLAVTLSNLGHRLRGSAALDSPFA
jgi:hypothetical protein